MAATDIKKDQELFLNYSYEYWHGFYQLYKQHPLGFFTYWEKMRDECIKEYGPFIVGDSETLKLQVEEEVYSPPLST
jgi:hypothetical protein